jgi:hypothetical protein
MEADDEIEPGVVIRSFCVAWGSREADTLGGPVGGIGRVTVCRGLSTPTAGCCRGATVEDPQCKRYANRGLTWSPSDREPRSMPSSFAFLCPAVVGRPLGGATVTAVV